MIAIKPYLDDSPGGLCLRALTLLTDGMMQHPVEANVAECARFRGDVGVIQKRIGASSTNEQLLTAAEAIGQELTTHHNSVNAFIKNQAAELMNIIAMLAETVKLIGAANDESGKRLDNLASQLKCASTIEDIHVLRNHLGVCLKAVGLEAERQKTEIRGHIARLKNELGSTERRMSSDGIVTDIDRITGLAGREAAISAIQDSVTGVDNCYIAVLVLNKLHTINIHFGYSVGDEVFREFVTYVTDKLPAGTPLYRWSGPTIIAILRSSKPVYETRSEVSRIAETPSLKSLVRHGQSAYITTTAAWSVMSLVPPATDLVAQIDGFVSKQVPRTA